jgi:hypothetical protein
MKVVVAVIQRELVELPVEGKAAPVDPPGEAADGGPEVVAVRLVLLRRVEPEYDVVEDTIPIGDPE